jgi:hypothetical protein
MLIAGERRLLARFGQTAALSGIASTRLAKSGQTAAGSPAINI